jgi:hypothetical protein
MSPSNHTAIQLKGIMLYTEDTEDHDDAELIYNFYCHNSFLTYHVNSSQYMILSESPQRNKIIKIYFSKQQQFLNTCKSINLVKHSNEYVETNVFKSHFYLFF